jgi:dipeptidase D
MVGATKLDMSVLKSKRMINLDSEEDDTVTVSCAGGSDFKMFLPLNTETVKGYKVSLKLFGLLGGHSGVDINKHRENANVLVGRVLNLLKDVADFRIESINGGDKSNAITPLCKLSLIFENGADIIGEAEKCLENIKEEISVYEPEFDFSVSDSGFGEYQAFSKELTEKVITILENLPNGVVAMSREIEGLVETSLNLGILATEENRVFFDFALRSNKSASLRQLENELTEIANSQNAETEISGHYPPWEYKPNSDLQNIYIECFKEHYGVTPKVEAIHAGLECGIFDAGIKDLTAIAVGPQMYDVHTVKERLSISSTKKFTHLLVSVLGKLN